LKHVWQDSLAAIRHLLDVSELNLDGSHTIAKKGGESVAYQGRKKAKTSNNLPIFVFVRDWLNRIAAMISTFCD
jgi:hypothetical protein